MLRLILIPILSIQVAFSDDKKPLLEIYNKHYPEFDYWSYDLSKSSPGFSVSLDGMMDAAGSNREKKYVSEQGWKIKEWVREHPQLKNLQDDIRADLGDQLGDMKYHLLPDEAKLEALEIAMRATRKEFYELMDSLNSKETNDYFHGLILDENGNKVIENSFMPPTPFTRYVDFPYRLPIINREFHQLYFSTIDFNNHALFQSKFGKLGLINAHFEYSFLKEFWNSVELKARTKEELFEKLFNVAHVYENLLHTLNNFDTPEKRFFNILKIIKDSKGGFGDSPFVVYNQFLEWIAKREDLRRIVPTRIFYQMFFDSLHAVKSRDVYLNIQRVTRIYKTIDQLKPILDIENFEHIQYLADRSLENLPMLQGRYIRVQFDCKGYLYNPETT